MFNFLHNFEPSPILADFGLIKVYWYGLLIAVAMTLGIFVFKKLVDKKLSNDEVLDLSFWLIIGSLIGARAYHIFLEYQYYLAAPLEIFKVWKGGLAIHGGIIGGFIVLCIFTKKFKKDFWFLTGALAPALALGQAVGRWGNYFNNELFGAQTKLPWGIPIVSDSTEKFYVHPVFLYESCLNFLVFIILFVFFKLKIFKPKIIFSLYLIFYGLIRFLLEFLRTDHTLMVLGIRWPQIFSLGLVLIGAILILLDKLNIKNVYEEK